MHLSVRLKFWIYEHYWWLLILAVAVAVGTLLTLKEPITTIATAVGALLSIAYLFAKTKT
jgi:hypothetical protein